MIRLLFLTATAQATRIIGILFGDDADEWGCKPSTGYVWCNETQDCIPMNELCVALNQTFEA